MSSPGPTALALRAQLHRALARIGPLQRYGTMDIPMGLGNIGSHLLWLAESLYFANVANAELVYASSAADYVESELRTALDGAPLILRSGYLGDQWDAAGGHRRQMIESLVDDFEGPVVIMPQSVDYRDPDKLAGASAIFARHRELTLFAREDRARENARTYFPDATVHLSPDVVFHLADLPELRRPRRPGDTILYLRRSDWDGGADFEPERLGLPRMVVHEWLLDPPLDAKQQRELARWERAPALPERLRRGPHAATLRYAWKLLYLAIAQLERHRLVVTNRLHGHILCVLLGIPHVLLPGPYDKTRAFHRTWTRAEPRCRFAASGGDVRAAAEELLASEGCALD